MLWQFQIEMDKLERLAALRAHAALVPVQIIPTPAMSRLHRLASEPPDEQRRHGDGEEREPKREDDVRRQRPAPPPHTRAVRVRVPDANIQILERNPKVPGLDVQARPARNVHRDQPPRRHHERRRDQQRQRRAGPERERA